MRNLKQLHTHNGFTVVGKRVKNHKTNKIKTIYKYYDHSTLSQKRKSFEEEKKRTRESEK